MSLNFELQETWFLLPNWKWFALSLGVFAAYLLKGISRHILGLIQNRLLARFSKSGFVKHFLHENIQSPGSWIFTALFLTFLFDVLNLHEDVTKYFFTAFKLILVLNVIRVGYMAVDALGKRIEDWSKTTENTLDDQLAPFITKTLKLMVVVLGVLIALQNFGVNVWSLMAGLGIGGIALALAGQETAANLFGSITILLDRPFQIGDYIKVADTEGLVEEVGFRSTRIRTFYNSLITIPNSTMAKEKIDNMGIRLARRIRHNLGIVYGVTPEQIEAYCERIHATICLIPEAIKEDVTVVFNAYGDFSLNILVNFHVRVASVQEENRIQQNLLLEIMKISSEMKVDFAFPTRTVVLQNANPPA